MTQSGDWQVGDWLKWTTEASIGRLGHKMGDWDPCERLRLTFLGDWVSLGRLGHHFGQLDPQFGRLRPQNGRLSPHSGDWDPSLARSTCNSCLLTNLIQNSWFLYPFNAKLSRNHLYEVCNKFQSSKHQILSKTQTSSFKVSQEQNKNQSTHLNTFWIKSNQFRS